MTNPGEIKVAAAAIPGCQHVLAGGLHCQDAALTSSKPDRVILAVSDGHGAEEYTFSDEGARIAVAVAVDVLGVVADRIAAEARAFVEPSAGRADLDTLEEDLVPPLKRRIAFEWNRRVKHHVRMVAARDGGPALWPDGVTGDWHESVKPYGCTLLAAVFMAEVTIWLQLGDGGILLVAPGGPRRVFDPADKSMGQETFSLSMRGAMDYASVRFDCVQRELVVIASDGVTDQYDESPSFEEEWGTRMLERIRAKGWTQTALDLPRYLGGIARDGDDCTVALAYFPPEPE